MAEIERQSGRHFDPRLVQLFLEHRWAVDIRSLGEAVLTGYQGEAPEAGVDFSPLFREAVAFRR